MGWFWCRMGTKMQSVYRFYTVEQPKLIFTLESGFYNFNRRRHSKRRSLKSIPLNKNAGSSKGQAGLITGGFSVEWEYGNETIYKAARAIGGSRWSKPSGSCSIISMRQFRTSQKRIISNYHPVQ